MAERARRSFPSVLGLGVLLATGLATTGCSGADPEDARGALVVRTLVEADRDFIGLRPDWVQTKYRLMAESPQSFLRGTAGLFYRDLTARDGTLTARGGPGTAQVTLYGDVHVENIGATTDPEGALLECTDFDSALPGPFDFDVQRGAMALVTALRMGQRDDALVGEAVRAFARGYLQAMGDAAAGSPRPPLRRGMGLGPVADDLLARALKAAVTREDLSRYTTRDDSGARRLVRDGDTVEPPAPFGDRAALYEALLRYRSVRRGGPLPEGALAIKDVARRLNSGLASLPNLRLWVLCEGPPGDDDDLILELKEERDPPLPLAQLAPGTRSPRSGADPTPLAPAARALAAANVLLSDAGVEPDFGHLSLHGLSFLVRAVSRARRNLDVAGMAADLQASKVHDPDAVTLAGAIGRLVGAGHGRSGREAAAAIIGVAGDPAAFADDTLRRALAAHAQLLTDLALFQDALRTRGPLLGAVVPR